MKDAITIWSRIWGWTYSVVNTNSTPCEQNAKECKRQKSSIRTQLRGILTLTFFGLVTFGSGLFVVLLHPYDILFKWKCVFADGGEIFELWRTPPVDLYLKVFLFNVTNKDAFLSGSEKLKVQEVGPYVYREYLSHENVTFNENGTLSARPSHPLEWAPDLSEGHKEDDLLILPHIALLAISHVVAEKSYFTQFGLNLVIRQSGSYPLVQMTAKEFMFGYKSALLSLGNQFMSDWINFDKLGLIERMYDFDGDYETIYNGEGDVSRTGLLDTYKGSPQLPHWNGPCGNIRNASDGTKFNGYLKPEDKLLFYRKSLCRASTLVFENTTVASGLDGYRYTFENNSLDNGKNNPNNECFCRNGKCLPSGILDVTDCYYGFPIGVSFPHFLYGDQSLRDSVDGSYPDPAKHKSHFIIEPVSGLPLNVAARYQINMVLGNMNSIAHVEQFSNMVLPMLWIEIGMSSLPQTLKMRFNLYLYVLPLLQTSAIYLCFIIGTILLVLASYKYLQRLKMIGRFYHTSWADPYSGDEDVNRKLSSFEYVQREEGLMQKEFDIYFDSIIIPLDESITSTDSDDPKENI